MNSKYKNWEWTYGLSPRYEYNRDARLVIGTINFSLTIENQRISKIKISGDFFTKKDIKPIEEQLIGTKMTFEDLTKVLKDIKLSDYFFADLDEAEIAKIILDEQ